MLDIAVQNKTELPKIFAPVVTKYTALNPAPHKTNDIWFEEAPSLKDTSK